MSWLFGAVCNSFAPEHVHRFTTIHPQPLHFVRSTSLYVACGGLEETCGFDEASDAKAGWYLVGTGITSHGERCSLLSRDGWQKIFSAPDPDLSRLDGHFCIVRWLNDTIEVFVDEIGLRTLHIAPIEGGYCFSSRVDWLAQAAGNAEIAFDELGTQWCLTNKLSYGSFLNGAVRIGPGGRGRLSSRSFEASNKPWLPVIAETAENTIVQTLTSFLHPELPEGKTLSLGLSGGFDCRVLLGLLASSRNRQFVVHTFGGNDNPDVAIAKRISRELSLPLDQFDESLPPVAETISLLKRYAAQTCLVSPVSTVLKLRYYDAMHSRGRVLIDGGYGEISRRQMGNRLLRRGAKALSDGNPAVLFSMMRQHRADIFTPEVEAAMRRHALLEIESVWREMPSVDEIGAENVVDVFSLRTRVANSSPAPQDWIDSQIVNYMPYVQPAFLREVFHVPLRERRNARLYRRVIQSRCPMLSSFPLEKNGVTYPYSFGTIPSWMWRMTKTKFGLHYDEPYNHQLLVHIREFVRDTAHSNETKTFAPYDYKKVVGLVDAFYAGKAELAAQVDWWLTFELWRESLRKS